MTGTGHLKMVNIRKAGRACMRQTDMAKLEFKNAEERDAYIAKHCPSNQRIHTLSNGVQWALEGYTSLEWEDQLIKQAEKKIATKRRLLKKIEERKKKIEELKKLVKIVEEKPATNKKRKKSKKKKKKKKRR